MPSNFAVLLVCLTLKTCEKISFSKQAYCSLTTGFLGPKGLRTLEKQAPTEPDLAMPRSYCIRAARVE